MTRSLLAPCLMAVLALTGCFGRQASPKPEAADGTVEAVTADRPQALRRVAVLPILNRTDEAEAPVRVASELGRQLAGIKDLKIVAPEEARKKLAPMYETGMIGRFVTDLDEDRRTSADLARLVGAGLGVDGVLVATVTLYQQFTDRFPDGNPGEAATTIVAVQGAVVDTLTGRTAWSNAVLERVRGGRDYPPYDRTVESAVRNLLATWPR
ncbi:MAG: hypothetical protein VKO64_06845 [Candidatus Sericytochromatia bacterium]|nr:hypothetical protein [Candidatus Sericytochromatia bacterium]